MITCLMNVFDKWIIGQDVYDLVVMENLNKVVLYYQYLVFQIACNVVTNYDCKVYMCICMCRFMSCTWKGLVY